MTTTTTTTTTTIPRSGPGATPRHSRVLALLAGASLFAACGSGTNGGSNSSDPGGGGSALSGSCDFRTQQGYCQDYQSTQPGVVTQYQNACSQMKISGRWSSSLCPHDGVAGGCRSMSNGITITNWFATSASIHTAADVMSICQSPSTYVSP
jgi:hypothetical protein